MLPDPYDLLQTSQSYHPSSSVDRNNAAARPFHQDAGHVFSSYQSGNYAGRESPTSRVIPSYTQSGSYVGRESSMMQASELGYGLPPVGLSQSGNYAGRESPMMQASELGYGLPPVGLSQSTMLPPVEMVTSILADEVVERGSLDKEQGLPDDVARKQLEFVERQVETDRIDSEARADDALRREEEQVINQREELVDRQAETDRIDSEARAANTVSRINQARVLQEEEDQRKAEVLEFERLVCLSNW
jgi:hypothetical protein